MSTRVLYSERVLLAGELGLQAASVYIQDGKIMMVEAGRADHPELQDFGSLVLMPGIVDPHVHVNEPGRTEWEGFETATRAAAAGGVTTLVDMPLNSDPVTTTQEAFAQKKASAKGKCWVDVGFWGGVIPGNKHELESMIADGILGFKAFLIHSGIDDFPHSGADDLREAMPILARHNLPLLVHAELDGDAPEHSEHEAGSYQAFLNSRPRDWEDRAIRMMIELCRETDCHTHIVHLSSASALPDIQAARAEGLPFSVETCPHYLYFAAEQIPDAHPEYKCMPPIREAENGEALWQGIKDGSIDCVVTDHSPCTPGLKHLEQGDVLHAWGGIASLQFGMASVWTRARERGFILEDLSRLMSAAPAKFAGIDQYKGMIKPGYDADLVLWDPEAQFEVKAEDIFFRHPVTPYAKQKLYGVVYRTWVRGQEVYTEGKHSPEAQGEFLLKANVS